MIYEPAEDSFLLNKYVRKYVNGKVLDMGTGTGIQAVAALENTEEVLAVDINEEAVEYVKKKNINAIQSDLFEKVEGKFDWIIFNPPYLPLDENEPEDSRQATTGGEKGNEILLKFLEEAKQYLNVGGKILVLVSSLTGEPTELFKDYEYKCLETENLFMEKISVYLLWEKNSLYKKI
jgi:release factor glutamine methyltransferase